MLASEIIANLKRKNRRLATINIALWGVVAALCTVILCK